MVDSNVLRQLDEVAFGPGQEENRFWKAADRTTASFPVDLNEERNAHDSHRL
jgi:hypothetical protein